MVFQLRRVRPVTKEAKALLAAAKLTELPLAESSNSFRVLRKINFT